LGDRYRRVIIFYLTAPLAVLALAYAWLAVDRGALWLWEVNVHESGRYTLRETIFYFNHFLREIPVDVNMALFLLAGFMNLHEIVPDKAPDLRERFGVARWAWLLLAVAAGLMVAAFVVTANRQGVASAALDLLQFRTRDYLSEYGSHWRFHWLSTLWFGVAAMLGAPLIARLCGQTSGADQRGRKLLFLAWGYFAALTIVFRFSGEPFTDVRYTGHQAREIMTHGSVTYLLAFGALHSLAARLAGMRNAECGMRNGGGTSIRIPHSAFRIPHSLLLILFLLIPLYLAVVTLSGDMLEAGQSERGLAAMVGAHFFEHVLDYLLVTLLATGGYALLLAKQFQKSELTAPA
jgi:hypothetical protein